jgi:hypothetical protein
MVIWYISPVLVFSTNKCLATLISDTRSQIGIETWKRKYSLRIGRLEKNLIVKTSFFQGFSTHLANF